jgi:acetoin utilization deacetylase AcuC-like enzyme
MRAELHLVDQRPCDDLGAPWVLEAGERKAGCEDSRRVSRVRSGLSSVEVVRACEADAGDEELDETIAALHQRGYLDALGLAGASPEMLPSWTAPGMPADTPVTAGAVAAAREGVRTAVTAAHLTISGASFSYALCRPPGHHAGPSWLGGYCYMNNAAAALRTLRAGGVQRVGVLDIDLHYPNGTAVFAAEDRVPLHSLHAHPVTNVPGETVVPVCAEERSFEFRRPPSEAEYLGALERSLAVLTPSVDALVISVGYDIVRGDPHGCWTLAPSVFESIGARLAASGRPLCIVQEGGYALGELAACGRAFADGLLNGEDGHS